MFAVVAAFEMLCAMLMFIFRNALHSAAALALLFFANSLAFLLLGQPLIAIIGLFVTVGGISTYMFVSVASVRYPQLKARRALSIGLLSVLVFLAMSYPIFSWGAAAANAPMLSISALSPSLAASLPFFYLIAALLFGSALGAVLILKKAGVAP